MEMMVGKVMRVKVEKVMRVMVEKVMVVKKVMKLTHMISIAIKSKW